MPLTIKELQDSIHALMIEKGFKEKMEHIREVAGEEELGYHLGALLATEPAEYIDAVKKGKGREAELEEAADTIIRALNIFIMNGADAEEVIAKKMDFNMNRPHLYGHAN